MKKYMTYGSMMAFGWLFITGSVQLSALFIGLALGLTISYSFRRLYGGQITLQGVARIPYFGVYVSLFLKELLISNFEAAYRILHPKLLIDPKFITYDVDLDHPTAIAILANSITLTPGTLAVDYHNDSKEMDIHCLNVGDPKKVREEIKKWEKILKKAFGETQR